MLPSRKHPKISWKEVKRRRCRACGEAPSRGAGSSRGRGRGFLSNQARVTKEREREKITTTVEFNQSAFVSLLPLRLGEWRRRRAFSVLCFYSCTTSRAGRLVRVHGALNNRAQLALHLVGHLTVGANGVKEVAVRGADSGQQLLLEGADVCLLYTSPSPRDS